MNNDQLKKLEQNALTELRELQSKYRRDREMQHIKIDDLAHDTLEAAGFSELAAALRDATSRMYYS